MPIHNEIFDSYRAEVEKLENAIRLLVKHKYKVIDLENQLIHDGNVDRPRERSGYGRVSKHQRVYLKTSNNNKNESNVN